MSEAIQVTPGGVRAFDGDKVMDVEIGSAHVSFAIDDGERPPQSVSMSPTTLGFLIGSLMRSLDPENLAGLRRPGAYNAFPTAGYPSHLQIYDQQGEFRGVAAFFPERGPAREEIEQRFHDDMMCILSLIDGADEACEAWRRVNAYVEALVAVGIRREERIKTLEETNR